MQELREPVEIQGPDYLLQALFTAGPISPSAMGTGPLTWVELQAWNDATGAQCTPWELETIRYLSQVYAAESNRARDPTAAPPHIQQAPRVEAKQIKNIFSQAASDRRKR